MLRALLDVPGDAAAYVSLPGSINGYFALDGVSERPPMLEIRERERAEQSLKELGSIMRFAQIIGIAPAAFWYLQQKRKRR